MSQQAMVVEQLKKLLSARKKKLKKRKNVSLKLKKFKQWRKQRKLPTQSQIVRINSAGVKPGTTAGPQSALSIQPVVNVPSSRQAEVPIVPAAAAAAAPIVPAGAPVGIPVVPAGAPAIAQSPFAAKSFAAPASLTKPSMNPFASGSMPMSAALSGFMQGSSASGSRSGSVAGSRSGSPGRGGGPVPISMGLPGMMYAPAASFTQRAEAEELALAQAAQDEIREGIAQGIAQQKAQMSAEYQVIQRQLEEESDRRQAAEAERRKVEEMMRQFSEKNEEIAAQLLSAQSQMSIYQGAAGQSESLRQQAAKAMQEAANARQRESAAATALAELKQRFAAQEEQFALVKTSTDIQPHSTAWVKRDEDFQSQLNTLKAEATAAREQAAREIKAARAAMSEEQRKNEALQREGKKLEDELTRATSAVKRMTDDKSSTALTVAGDSKASELIQTMMEKIQGLREQRSALQELQVMSDMSLVESSMVAVQNKIRADRAARGMEYDPKEAGDIAWAIVRSEVGISPITKQYLDTVGVDKLTDKYKGAVKMMKVNKTQPLYTVFKEYSPAFYQHIAKNALETTQPLMIAGPGSGSGSGGGGGGGGALVESSTNPPEWNSRWLGFNSAVAQAIRNLPQPPLPAESRAQGLVTRRGRVKGRDASGALVAAGPVQSGVSVGTAAADPSTGSLVAVGPVQSGVSVNDADPSAGVLVAAGPVQSGVSVDDAEQPFTVSEGEVKVKLEPTDAFPPQPGAEGLQGATSKGKGKPGTSGGLSDSELGKLVKKTGGQTAKFFRGVYSRDELRNLQLPQFSPSSFIINTDPSTKSGEHWVAMFIDPRKSAMSAEYFDSLGHEPSAAMNKDITAMLKKNFNKSDSMLKFKVNGVKTQNAATPNCGFFALKFITKRSKGVPFAEASGFIQPKGQTAKGEKQIRVMKRKFGYV